MDDKSERPKRPVSLYNQVFKTGMAKVARAQRALDCRVYARAAAWILGADRWDESTWRRLEEQAGVETRQQSLTAETSPAQTTAPQPAKAGTPTTPRRKPGFTHPDS